MLNVSTKIYSQLTMKTGRFGNKEKKQQKTIREKKEIKRKN